MASYGVQQRVLDALGENETDTYVRSSDAQPIRGLRDGNSWSVDRLMRKIGGRHGI